MRGTTGLLSSVTGGAGTGPQGFVGMGADTPESDQDMPAASPDEQAQYDALVNNGAQIIYTEDGKVNPEVLKRLSTGKKPIDTLAQTTVWLVMMLESSAKKNGTEISDDALLHGGKELFELLVEIDETMGIHKFKEAELQGAWYQALDMYREANSDDGDRFGGDGGAEAADAFSQLNDADQNGQADEVVPGFYQNIEKGISMAKADENTPDSENQDKITLNQKIVGNG